MKTPIKLGREMSDMAVSAPTPEDVAREVFPTIYLSDIPGIDKFPEEGEMTVKFRLLRSTSTVSADGKKSTSVDLELKCICEIESEEKMEHGKKMKTEDILDELLKKVSEESEDEGDEFENEDEED